MNQSMTSNEDFRKENIRYSQPSLSGVRYSRHLSIQHERMYLNGKSRLIIRVTTRSPERNRSSQENKSADTDRDLHSISTILKARYHQDKANDSYVNSNSPKQNATHSESVNRNFEHHRSLPKSIHNNRNSNDLTKYFQEQSKTKDNKNNNVKKGVERQQFSSNSNGSFNNNNSSISLDHNTTTEKKDLWSNTIDWHKNSKINKKRRKRYLGGCPCLITCLFTALLLSIAIAAALVATLIKPQITTTSVTTIASTILTTTTMATTVTTTTIASTIVITTTSTTTSTTQTSTDSTTSVTTTLTTASCNIPNNTLFHYAASISYTQVTYNYTASTTGIAVLEFIFLSQGANKYAYLDNVSIADASASNSEMLVNGDFENGTLVGWQQLCTSNCGGSPGALSTSSCYAGSFCYTDACQNGPDFLQQTFNTIIGHVYVVSKLLLLSKLKLPQLLPSKLLLRQDKSSKL